MRSTPSSPAAPEATLWRRRAAITDSAALVTEREIARDRLWEELRLAVEPAAAVPFAAWLDGRVPGRHPGLVLCGANTDWHPE